MKFIKCFAVAIVLLGQLSAPTLAQKDDKLRLDEAAIRGKPGERVLEGQISNTTARPFTSVDVRFRLTDAAGTQIGTVSDSTRDLAAQSTWKFEIDVSDQAANFEMTQLDGEQEPQK